MPDEECGVQSGLFVCDEFYISETARLPRKRMEEHFRVLHSSQSYTGSPLSKHSTLRHTRDPRCSTGVNFLQELIRYGGEEGWRSTGNTAIETTNQQQEGNEDDHEPYHHSIMPKEWPLKMISTPEWLVTSHRPINSHSTFLALHFQFQSPSVAHRSDPLCFLSLCCRENVKVRSRLKMCLYQVKR